MIPNTTILIKTFDRPDSLRRLLVSLSEYAPQTPILVADDGQDSAEQVCVEFPTVIYFQMDFDSGLSAGRNLLVSRTETSYCIILDDDFQLEDDQSLPRLVSELTEWPYDIVTGKLLLENGKSQHYEGWMIECGHELILARPTTTDTTIPIEIGLNFFAARVAALKRVMWDVELKVCEHEDFFWRAKREGIEVGYCPRSTARHLRDHSNGRYATFRNRTQEMRTRAMAKHGWERMLWVKL